MLRRVLVKYIRALALTGGGSSLVLKTILLQMSSTVSRYYISFSGLTFPYSPGPSHTSSPLSTPPSIPWPIRTYLAINNSFEVIRLMVNQSHQQDHHQRSQSPNALQPNVAFKPSIQPCSTQWRWKDVRTKVNGSIGPSVSMLVVSVITHFIEIDVLALDLLAGLTDNRFTFPTPTLRPTPSLRGITIILRSVAFSSFWSPLFFSSLLLLHIVLNNDYLIIRPFLIFTFF